MSSVITTDFERWKAQEAALGKPVALNEFVFANVQGLDPSKDISRDEKLPPAGQIVHRQAVNKAGLASENAVAYSVTLGTDVGDFVFNWIGLINKESGTLAMITHAPEQRKIKTVDGVQGNVLTRSFLLEFNGAATETQITTSAETWQIDFTARLAGMDEIQRLANRDIYGTAAFFGDGFLVTKTAEQYRVTPGTAYIEGLRGTLEEITAFNNLRDTKIYADFTFQGNLVSKWQTFVKVTSAKTLAHYLDAAGFQHYVAVIAEIDKNGNITDKRVKGTAIDRELAELKKELPNTYQPKGDYQPAGSYVTTANFSLELNKKIDKASIADQLGNETTKVPSLHLLITEIGKLQPKGNYQVAGNYADKSSAGLQEFSGGIRAPYIDAATGEDRTGLRAMNKRPLIYSEIAGKVYQAVIPLQNGTMGFSEDYPKLPLIGSGSTRNGVTDSRQLGITYINDKPYSIFVTVMLQSSTTEYNLITIMKIKNLPASDFYVGVNGAGSGILAKATHAQIVLPGESYVVTATTVGAKIVSWVEIAV
ncbi:TPA: phage tail protein [Morganella morganii]